jgi:hypothetical protein
MEDVEGEVPDCERVDCQFGPLRPRFWQILIKHAALFILTNTGPLPINDIPYTHIMISTRLEMIDI